MKTIKIVGAAGSGKTTLIAEIKKVNNEIKSISYGDLLQKISRLSRVQLHLSRPKDHQAADVLFREFLSECKNKDSLILIDDHIEIKTQLNLYQIYQKENTIGIIFLKPASNEILNRRHANKIKHYHYQTLKQIEQDQRMTEQIAADLAKKLSIPFLVLESHALEQITCLALRFIQQITGG